MVTCESYQFIDSHTSVQSHCHRMCVASVCLIGHQASRKSKDDKVFVIQNPSHCACCLVFGYICLYKPCEVVYNNKNIFCLWFLPQVPWFSILMKSIWTKSMGLVASMGVSFGVWMPALMIRHCLQFLRAKADSFAMPGHQNSSFSRLSIWSCP